MSDLICIQTFREYPSNLMKTWTRATNLLFSVNTVLNGRVLRGAKTVNMLYRANVCLLSLLTPHLHFLDYYMIVYVHNSNWLVSIVLRWKYLKILFSGW